MARVVIRVIVPDVTDEEAISLKRDIEALLKDKPNTSILLDIREHLRAGLYLLQHETTCNNRVTCQL